MTTLHYLHDPLCGWCYGAAPLLEAARGMADLRIVLHGGGLFVGASRQQLGESLRRHILEHDRRIAALTGQPFGEAYREKLLNDATAVLDSAPPLAAVLAADALAGRGLDMLHTLQVAHYQQGRHIVRHEVLQGLAEDLGLPPAGFAAELQHQLTTRLETHMSVSHHLLARLGGNGYPTLALERDGCFEPIEIGRFLGRPEAFRRWLGERDSDAAHPGAEVFCDPAAPGNC